MIVNCERDTEKQRPQQQQQQHRREEMENKSDK